MTHRLVIALIAAATFFAAPAAYAVRESRPVLSDHRVHLITYQPDQVYKYTGFYRYAAEIDFSADEEIKTISMGDSTAWMINPAPTRHRLS